MSKYSNEFKLEVVKYYLNNNCGCNYLINHFNIPARTIVRKWVRKYNKHGPKELMKNFKLSLTFILICIRFYGLNNLNS